MATRVFRKTCGLLIAFIFGWFFLTVVATAPSEDVLQRIASVQTQRNVGFGAVIAVWVVGSIIYGLRQLQGKRQRIFAATLLVLEAVTILDYFMTHGVAGHFNLDVKGFALFVFPALVELGDLFLPFGSNAPPFAQKRRSF